MDARHPLLLHTAGLLACAVGAGCGSYEDDTRETTVHHTHAVTTGAEAASAPLPSPQPASPQPPPQVVVVQTPPPQVVIMDGSAEPPPVYVAAPPAPPPPQPVVVAPPPPPAPAPAPVVAAPPPPPAPAPVVRPTGPAPITCSGNQRVRVHDRKIEGGAGPAVHASGSCVVTMTECIVRGEPAVIVQDQARVDLIECKVLGDVVSAGAGRVEMRGSRHRGGRFHH